MKRTLYFEVKQKKLIVSIALLTFLSEATFSGSSTVKLTANNVNVSIW